MSVAPLVTVIVVNYNGRDHLAESLSALCDDDSYPEREIFLVDNASQDGSVLIAEDFGSNYLFFHILKSPINRGYAGGINIALQQANGKYIAVLNMDVNITAGWLLPLVNFMEGNPEVGAASPLLVLEGDENRVNAAGQDIHVSGLGFNRALGKLQSQIGIISIRISGIHGAAFIIRRSILDEMGGLDESGFLYHEDVDLSCLMHIMGYDLYCVPQSIVKHKYFLTMYPKKLYLLERNRLKMLLEDWQPFSLCVLAPLLVLTEVMMWGYCALRGKDFLLAKLATYGWVRQQKKHIKERKSLVQNLRKRSDWQVMKRLVWKYTWDQFLHLGRERGYSKRQPEGGLPVTIDSLEGKKL
jgi:GT2 family glycosyltransferase